MEKLTNGALVTPTPGLYIAGSSQMAAALIGICQMANIYLGVIKVLDVVLQQYSGPIFAW